MKIAFIIYEGVTLLDFSGMYDPLTRLKTMGLAADICYHVCAKCEIITSFEGVKVIPDKVNPVLSEYDMICIPGGNGIAKLLSDSGFLGWLKNTAPGATLAAVCGGSLLLGAAGYLQGKKAATHPMMMEYLKKFAGEVSDERIVQDGNVITARGVTAAIDLGLYLCEKTAGKQAREKIQKQMDYNAYPLV